jgi:hypothetical protein
VVGGGEAKGAGEGEDARRRKHGRRKTNSSIIVKIKNIIFNNFHFFTIKDIAVRSVYFTAIAGPAWNLFFFILQNIFNKSFSSIQLRSSADRPTAHLNP